MSSIVSRLFLFQQQVLSRAVGSGLRRQSVMRRGNYRRGGDDHHGYPEPGSVSILIIFLLVIIIYLYF